MTRLVTSLLLLAALLLTLLAPVAAQEDPSPDPSPPPPPTAVPANEGPLVQAVLFFSPTCGHCHYVISEVLPGLFAEHGGEPVITIDEEVAASEVAFYLMSNGRLQLLLVDASVADGQAMFQADSVRLDIDEAGVPRLTVADTYLVGSADIPDVFPDMVAEGLAGDGIGWPAVPGLEDALAPFVGDGSVPDPAATAEPDPAATPEPSTAPEPGATASGEGAADEEDGSQVALPIGDDEGPLDKLARDPLGNGVSVVVLILLAASVLAAPLLAARGSLPAFPAWLVPVLALVGMAVAVYLAGVETSGAEAVCGPVGDCNAVQESEYARILGIPVGVLGLLGYGAIGALWVVSRVAGGELADWATVLVGVGAFAGTLFSIYLTFLEPFVIGATCMWCITSALVMLALLWVSFGPAVDAWHRRRGGGSASHAAAGA